ncbi:meiotic recombination protein Rec15 [Schizosaccharomyces pombe]|uniref:Meiotic recombination protein rec15 n=1 Tax=Schizosaccharomyces pombe (strain 972 / ATCC 24843) TaxID=284812 RepID=REC15_SCHPO|nr:meiotic recombination protein Rec15 [Schizosaccharomyces pombe]Q09094.1 RecName: Full=Meiotic recombination protein rec15 [Schizosaccharomyces pombe 972h-]AAA98494.1 Rec15p [Schizosaccharomyces pombe]CAB88244.1 meiotic recombination protein Rec15 [Schizosaccharomyces pombe]|eukprot:NP_595887.1 meiotic recombination protein Rec15 [Schizosaccharomyces pombe]
MSYSVSAAQLWSRKLAMQAEDMQQHQKSQSNQIASCLAEMNTKQEVVNQTIGQLGRSISEVQQQNSQLVLQSLNQINMSMQQVALGIQDYASRINKLEQTMSDMNLKFEALQKEQNSNTKTLADCTSQMTIITKKLDAELKKRYMTTKQTRTVQNQTMPRSNTTTKKRVLAIDFLADDDY